jgi:hypothetical protein
MSIFMAEVHFDEVMKENYETCDDEINGETLHFFLHSCRE